MIYAGYKKHPLGDEQYTPRHAVLPIIKYLPRKAVVWCPFDTENSEFVIALKEAGHEVVHSHIFTGRTFSGTSLSGGTSSSPILRSAGSSRSWNAASRWKSRSRFCCRTCG